MKFRFSLPHAITFACLFLIEAGIAIYIHDDLIRPLGGDALVVALVWAFWRCFVQGNAYLAALGAMLFSYAVEFGQYFHFVDLIGLGQNRIARIVLGTSFDVHDLGAYTLGAAAICGACYLTGKCSRGRAGQGS